MAQDERSKFPTSRTASKHHVLVLLAVAACAVVASANNNAHAATSPCGTKGNYFDGSWLTGVAQYGVQANIDTYKAALCGSASDSSAWVMEAGPGSNDGYAQSGYAHNGDGTWAIFNQWKEYANLTPLTAYYASPPSPGTLTYKVDYNFNTHMLQMWANGTLLDTSGWDPTIAWSWPWQGQFFGETFHCQSDVPGTSGAKVEFFGIKKKAPDGTWGSTNSLVLPTPSCGSSTRYHRQWAIQSQAFWIWTDPLN